MGEGGGGVEVCGGGICGVDGGGGVLWGDVGGMRGVEGVSKLICRINNWREWSGQHKCVKI